MNWHESKREKVHTHTLKKKQHETSEMDRENDQQQHTYTLYANVDYIELRLENDGCMTMPRITTSTVSKSLNEWNT